MDLQVSLRPCPKGWMCLGGEQWKAVSATIDRAHYQSQGLKALALGPDLQVLISSRAMRLLLSGSTIHVKTDATWEVRLVKKAGGRGEPMRQGQKLLPGTAGPFPRKEAA